ncbi:MAG: hypothetical protein WAT79_13955 [Saprospiraceae bacterium]
MNLQKILVSGIIIGVVSFFLGWLIWGILLADLLQNDAMTAISRSESDMIMWAMVVSNLLWGILLAYIYVEWAKITTWQSGAYAGAILGLLISASYDTGLYSMTTLYTLQDIVKDVVVNTIYSAILGAILGWWLGRK